MEKYKYEGDVEAISVSDVRQFVHQFLQGKLTPSFKSEPIPSDNSADLKTVVGESYDQIVLDQSKDVFVLFYSHSDEGSNKVLPHWERLASHVKGVDEIVIAKYNFFLNEKYHDLINDMPMPLFYPRGTDEYV